jgi:hypothetical protein
LIAVSDTLRLGQSLRIQDVCEGCGCSMPQARTYLKLLEHIQPVETRRDGRFKVWHWRHLTEPIGSLALAAPDQLLGRARTAARILTISRVLRHGRCLFIADIQEAFGIASGSARRYMQIIRSLRPVIGEYCGRKKYWRWEGAA